jgi:hypothetical protein
VDDVTWERWWVRAGREQLSELLWERWDPIGWPPSNRSSGFKPPRGEYAGYARPVADMFRAHKSAEEIAAHLEDVEANTIGLRNLKDQRAVARELLAWYARAVPHDQGS